MTNLSKYEQELDQLIKTTDLMDADLTFRSLDKEGLSELTKKQKELYKKVRNKFEKEYQSWYTEASTIIRQLIPDRLEEFIDLYKTDSRRKVVNSTTYSIQDWLNGVRSASQNYTGEKFFDDFAIVTMKFKTQGQILKAAKKRFSSSLFEIKQILQADLFDTELSGAEELNKKGFHRAAGVISGVVIEKHLRQVCSNHAITIRKKNPTINDFNELLKSNSIIEITDWRFIQRLGDLRNLCGHNKDKEPTKEEVEELIAGTDKIIKTLY